MKNLGILLWKSWNSDFKSCIDTPPCQSNNIVVLLMSSVTYRTPVCEVMYMLSRCKIVNRLSTDHGNHGISILEFWCVFSKNHGILAE